MQKKKCIELFLRPPAPDIVMCKPQVADCFHMFDVNKSADCPAFDNLLYLFIAFHEPEGMTYCHNLFLFLLQIHYFQTILEIISERLFDKNMPATVQAGQC